MLVNDVRAKHGMNADRNPLLIGLCENTGVRIRKAVIGLVVFACILVGLENAVDHVLPETLVTEQPSHALPKAKPVFSPHGKRTIDVSARFESHAKLAFRQGVAYGFRGGA